jgi:gag-polypeptide of LTR copia-type
MSEEYTTGSYRMEMLKGHNWMPWKRRMQAVLRDLGLEQYIGIDSVIPLPADTQKPTTEELEKQRRWRDGDAKARTRIELSISDAEMIHISGATTASEMWQQLITVKEAKGKLGMLALRRSLYRTVAEEGFNMIEHIGKLRKIQEELHLQNSKVSDEDFAIILLSSLPESWDVYTSAYLGSRSNAVSITLHELIAVLLEEYRRRQERNGDPGNVAMQSKGPPNGGRRQKANKSDIECYNCHKKGHMIKDCYAKGGPKEGQRPKSKSGNKNRSNQAQEDVNNLLSDVAYMGIPQDRIYAIDNASISRYDWILDSGTTSHISPIRESFITYKEVKETIRGIGKNPVISSGKGDITLNFKVDGKTVKHHLKDVFHIPEVPNCLLSSTRFDDTGGETKTKKGRLFLYNKDSKLVGTGQKVNRLWKLDARAQLQPYERAYISQSKGISWDEAHRRFGHLGMSGLTCLNRSQMVKGLTIDESTILKYLRSMHTSQAST